MNQKIQRVVTAVVLVPLAIGLTYLSGWFFLCAVILLSSMAIVEMSKMARKTAKSPQIVPLLVVNLAIQIMAYYRSWYLVLGTVFLFLVFLYLVEIF
ncbi:MAG TPA: phosphatidate cytidylyltransferase, partial [Caldisericia bacterium]|nr:phosphatidate cytidylyltransferase [Caldisericia bacterium]